MIRRTLASTAELSGRGLFTGLPASIRLHPAQPGTGLRLARAERVIPATLDHLAPPKAGMPARNTILAADAETPFITTEHVLSALVGLGITDAITEFTGPEAPIGDGSSLFIAEAIKAAGITDSLERLEPLIVAREVSVEGPGGARIVARPRSRPGCAYIYELDYGAGAPIPAQTASWDSENEGAYTLEIAPARTFCLQAEAEQMRAAGLFKDLSPRDLLVIGPAGPIENCYRFVNEPARHKVLDLIGDLALVGRPIQGEITATRAGHALNHAMARALLAEAAKNP